MKADEIRRRFLEYFEDRGHAILPSSSLVPEDDPTLLFTNAGMVQFKKIFLGEEDAPSARAVTSQKCVRAGGKHNDLEEVGKTARHHTFFEMLGNFSFGDYFKREAIRYAWELLTEVLGIDGERLFATIHESDDEAFDLWMSEVGMPPERIYRLGDKDNFWQMAETGPCGPCSELLYDLRSDGARREDPHPGTERFEELAERGEFLELWNLVFMQFERSEGGELTPLPSPAIDTGAGLERIAAVLQGVDSNFHTDLFTPLLVRVGEVVGEPYDPSGEAAVGYRVIADHARAVAFLLADGVFPSNEGRGYVLRRILRRAVRHAWLLGRRAPTLVEVVDVVVDTMGGAYAELTRRREHVLQTTRSEEERFLATIEGGMERFDEIAPVDGTGVIDGEDAFRLYDTFGFPLDLTELMASERGYEVDVDGFRAALESQRERSRADRSAAESEPSSEETLDRWTISARHTPRSEQTFAGYESTDVESGLLAWRTDEPERLGLVLETNPFYVEAGGQVSDRGVVEGDGWTVDVDRVDRAGPWTALSGTVTGRVSPDLATESVRARVVQPARHDTERNHTGTHLLHAALRAVLGDHVVQRGSLVAPDRLRFDFAHPAPLTTEERDRVEALVNEVIWKDHPVRVHHMTYEEAVDRGAMALFGEKYGDEVRVVEVPGVSIELCGGTHVRHTGEIGLFRVVGESGVAAGVRRIEAQTGPGAFEYLRRQERRLVEAADVLKTQPEGLPNRARQLVREREELERLLADVRRGGGGGEEVVAEGSIDFGAGEPFRFKASRLKARDADDARSWGDGFLEDPAGGVAVLGVDFPDDKKSLFAFVTDDLISKGLRADVIVREVAAVADGRGGGRPHMAQAGLGDPEKMGAALTAARAIVQRVAKGSS